MNMIEWITTSCILLAMISAIRQIFKEKLSARLRYGIWLIVLIRLLLPVSLTGSNISVLNLFTEGLQSMQQDQQPVVSSPANPNEKSTEAQGTNGSQNQTETVLSSNIPNPDSQNTDAGNAADSIWKKALTAIWIVGMAVCGLALVGSNLIFMRKLRRSRQLIPSHEISALEHDRPLPDHIPVYVSKLVNTPCLFGLFRPAIYIRPEDKYNQTNLPYILKHEYTHYRHLDHIWAFFRGICLVIHWYNPLVWAGAYWNRQDGELACDASVLAGMKDENRLAYGKLLIDLTKGNRPYGDMLCCATTMSGGKKNLKERIRRIAEHPKLFLIPTAITISLCLTVSWVTFTVADESEPQDIDIETDFESAEKLVNVMYADVTHDGVEDAIFTTVKFFADDEAALSVDELLRSFSTVTMVRVYDGNTFFNRYSADKEYWAQLALEGTLTNKIQSPTPQEALWERELGNPHVTNGLVFLTWQNGEAYLLDSSAWIGQGIGDFSYEVFSLDTTGTVSEKDSGHLSFSQSNFSQEKWEDIFPIPDMLAYTEQIAPWIEESVAVAVMDVGYEPLVNRPGQNDTIKPLEIWRGFLAESPTSMEDLEEKLEQMLQFLIAEDDLSESDSNSSSIEHSLDDSSVMMGDISLSLHENKQDIFAKLDAAGVSYSEFQPDNPENAKYDSCYNLWGMQLYFLNDECVRLRIWNFGSEGYEVVQTTRGIHHDSTYAQMVDLYGDSYETHTYAGKETYTIYRYSVSDFICEFGIPGENRDSIYNIDIYVPSQSPIYEYGEEIIS